MRVLVTSLALLLAVACARSQPETRRTAPRLVDEFEDAGHARGSYVEGEPFDATHTVEEFFRLSPKLRGPVPAPPVRLARPRVVVSLDGLTCRLYDAQGEFETVYPIGVGVRSEETGASITPVGDFRTHSDPDNGWFYIWERWVPEYFEGLPFLRIDARNSRHQMTYGLHGPITRPLKRGYVSHGCVRMRGDDIRELFAIVYSRPGAPVRIQAEADYDRYGVLYDAEHPRHHSPTEPLPRILIEEECDVRLTVVAPLRVPAGEPFALGVSVRGADAARVRHVVFNEGARWTGYLGPPRPSSETRTVRLDLPGKTDLYAIGLDEEMRPLAYGEASLTVDGIPAGPR